MNQYLGRFHFLNLSMQRIKYEKLKRKKNSNNLRTWISDELHFLPSPQFILSLVFTAKVPGWLFSSFCLNLQIILLLHFVFLNLSTKNSIFFLLLLKMYFSNFLKLVFLFICQNNHNPSYHLLGRLLQFQFPFFSCIKYSDHLILHFGQ